MWDGRDVGELYHIDSDPNETHNLYDDPTHADVVQECRRKLLEWLIDTTRNRTVHPPRHGIELHEDGTMRPQQYETAADGKESNRAGAAQRLADGNLNYL